MSKPARKTAVLLSNSIGNGVAVNTGLHLATQFGALHPDVAGESVRDATGVVHSGLPVWPNVVLSVSAEDLRKVVHRARRLAADSELLVLDYPAQGFSTSTDEAYRNAVAELDEESICYYGCLLFGARQLVDKSTKSVRTSLWDGSRGAQATASVGGENEC